MHFAAEVLHEVESLDQRVEPLRHLEVLVREQIIEGIDIHMFDSGHHHCEDQLNAVLHECSVQNRGLLVRLVHES